MNKLVLLILQIIFGAVLVFLILLQSKGSGLSSAAFGNIFSAYSTKRGVEKAVFNATIVFSVLFFISSILQLILG